MGRYPPALLVIAVAMLLSGCAVGVPRSVTYLSDTGATLNGNVYSSVEGDTTYQFFYGETTAYGAQSAPLTVFINDDAPRPVSVPFSGLTPNTTYHWQMCVHDQEEDPPREVCSEDQTFMTKAPGGVNAIAFSSNRDGNDEIYAMNTDGTNPRRLTNNPASDIDASWSPDGRRIAFSSDRDGGSREIYAIDADGGNPTRLTNNPASETQPAWSPAGDKLMFTRATSPGYAGSVVVEMNTDGSGERVVADVGTDWRSSFPFWAPESVGYGYSVWRPTGGFPPVEGGLFAFDASRKVVASVGDCMTADWHPFGRAEFVFACSFGGDTRLFTELTSDLGLGTDPSWSPHGLRIAFTHQGDIWTMYADGTNRVNRTNTPAAESSPAWSHRP